MKAMMNIAIRNWLVKNKDTILYKGRKYRFNISITRTIKKNSQQPSASMLVKCFIKEHCPATTLLLMTIGMQIVMYGLKLKEIDVGTCLIDFALQKVNLGVKNIF